LQFTQFFFNGHYAMVARNIRNGKSLFCHFGASFFKFLSSICFVRKMEDIAMSNQARVRAV
jgi:hypothetical protein